MRRLALLLLPLAALALAAPTAPAAPRPRPRSRDAWKVVSVDLSGSLSFSEDDRGYTGTATYTGARDKSAPFSLAPGTRTRPRLFTTVFRPVVYRGESRAGIRQNDASWDCSLTMPTAYAPTTLPITVTVTATTVHLNFTLVPPGIRCPEDAPAWTFGDVANLGRTMELEPRRLRRVRAGDGFALPVDMRAQGSRDGIAYAIRWRGKVGLLRVR